MDISVEKMAEAHLKTVEQAVKDLENQVQNIYQEIKKLNDYLEEGQKVIQLSRSAFVNQK
jgi:hypothetical protein